MKIVNDTTAPGFIPEKNEAQSRVSKKSGSEKYVPVQLATDELELTSKKAPAPNPMREVEIANAAAVEFDVGEVPMMKMKLAALNNYILNNHAEALSAQANLDTHVVAGLIS
jgi:hypothetical protein